MHNAPHTYAIITIRLFERREAFPRFKCAEQRLRSWASSEADCECPLYEKRASAAGNKSEIQAALSGTDHTEKVG